MPVPRVLTPIDRKRRDQVLSRRAVEGMIADGHMVVVFEQSVLCLDGWVDKHPGGELPVLHMVGMDATSEIKAYHSGSTLRLMRAYRVGRIEQPWDNFAPPIRGGSFRSVGDDTAFVDSGYESSVSSESEGCHQRVSVDAGQTPVNLTREARISDAMDAEIEKCLARYPSPDAATQSAITDKYTALHQRVQDEGHYTCRYSNYLKEMIRYTLLFSAFILCLKKEWYLTSALCLAGFWQQIMFTAHDAGHRGITSNFVMDTLIGIFIADFCCGLSIGWWKSSHNVHHLVTNSPEHDPDIQNVPLFATCPSQLKTVRSTYYNFTFVWDKACEVMIPYQKYAYYPVMAIARFNLYLLSWCHLLSPRAKMLGSASWTRSAELLAMSGYWFLFAYCLCWRALPDWPTRIAFVVLSHTSTMLLHVQITLSHWGMPTCDLGENESFAQKQLRTTMDVECPSWLDWLHGGLQFQAIHHLFPRVPRHNLRALQPMVQAFCDDTGIPYSKYGFRNSTSHVLGRLTDITDQLAMLGKCQDYMSSTGEIGRH